MSMIAGCPKCAARYRIDAERIGEDGAKLRCTKCSAVFLVRAPKAKPSPEVPSQAEAPSRAMPAPAPETGTDRDLSRLVLIADPNEERGKQTVAAIESWGLEANLVHDGVEAMLSIHRLPPKVVVLDVALPKMLGFQVCEVVKRNESLRHIKVVLIGAIRDQDRHRRDPADLYGADVYLEQPDLPDALLPLLREAGLPGSDSQDPASSEPSVVPRATEPAPIPTPASELPSAPPEPDPGASATAAPSPAEDPEITAERERGERLARIAVSEMLLYQPEKFDAAVRDQNLEEVLDLEIQEARALIRQRISEEVRAEKDFILEELQRVAEERRAQG